MTVSPRPLVAEEFSLFGDVVEALDDRIVDINQGTSQRFHDLARISIDSDGGRPLANIFRASPYPRPLTLTMMEKHPLGSQLFMPLQAHDYLVAVALPGPLVLAEDVNVFLARGHQGVNFHPGVWHHPLLVLVEQQDFIVIDRGGPGDNLVEAGLEKPVIVTLS